MTSLSEHSSVNVETATEDIGLGSKQTGDDRPNALTFGVANPSVMNNPFWDEMVRTRRQAWGSGGKSPIWCFSRWGGTSTTLADGRVVTIGGEHEDWYDPDFAIYNDVVVFDTKTKQSIDDEHMSFTIFGYPQHIFPPVDFHSATYIKEPGLNKEYIFIIGGLGYQDSEVRNKTSVWRLDLDDFSIEKMETCGEGPASGISRHEALNYENKGKQFIRVTVNHEEQFSLSLDDGRWKKE
jgi:hypothetical protein